MLLSICDTRGTRMEVGTGEFFYTENVTPEEATKVAYFLRDSIAFFDLKDRITVQFDKDTLGRYLLRMSAKPDTENQIDMINGAKSLCRAVSEEVLNGAPVNFHFLDFQFKTSKVVLFESFGKKIPLGQSVVYLKKGQVEDFPIAQMKNDTFFNIDLRTYQMEKLDSNRWVLKMIDTENIHQDSIRKAVFSEKVSRLSPPPSEFVFADFNFEKL